MTIKIIEDGPEITLTRSELFRLQQEYANAYQYYAGAVPSFEEFVRSKQQKLLNETASSAIDGH